MALGEHRQARADAQRFARNYARRRQFQRDAARMELALGDIFERSGDHAGAARHHVKILRRWGRASRGVQLLARVKLAAAIWGGACPVKGVSGICAVVRPRGASRGCQRPTMAPLRFRKRRAAASRRARAELTRALVAIKRKGGIEDDPELRAAATRAAFLVADQHLETFFTVRPPRLPVSGGAAAMSSRNQRALGIYLESKKRTMAEAHAAYLRVIDAAPPPAPGQVVAALARIAQLNISFADQLLALPLPRVVAPAALKGPARMDFIKTWRETYCDALDDRVTPMRSTAKKTLRQCAAQAAKHRIDDGWSRLCKKLDSALMGATP